MLETKLIRSQLAELECMEKCDREAILKTLINYQNLIKSNESLYYENIQDELIIEHYYCTVSIMRPSTSLFHEFHQLISKTHRYKFPYYLSKDQYLYTWVDLQPNGHLRCIYSGKEKLPSKVIEEDYKIIQKRFSHYQYFLLNDKFPSKGVKQNVMNFTKQHRFNTEHVVPQSWFKAKEPMKGDLHHLFVCEPKCNSARSNFPYFENRLDLGDPQSAMKINECGTYESGGFEPALGKGAVARAQLYFLLRYPRKISNKFLRKIDIPLLQKWHVEYPVNNYERHRNKAIFEIQGNRNPFIDIPELATEIKFNV